MFDPNVGEINSLSEEEVKRQTEKGNSHLIFTVGEKVKVKAVEFVVAEISPKGLVLALPKKQSEPVPFNK